MDKTNTTPSLKGHIVKFKDGTGSDLIIRVRDHDRRTGRVLLDQKVGDRRIVSLELLDVIPPTFVKKKGEQWTDELVKAFSAWCCLAGAELTTADKWPQKWHRSTYKIIGDVVTQIKCESFWCSVSSGPKEMNEPCGKMVCGDHYGVPMPYIGGLPVENTYGYVSEEA